MRGRSERGGGDPSLNTFERDMIRKTKIRSVWKLVIIITAEIVIAVLAFMAVRWLIARDRMIPAVPTDADTTELPTEEATPTELTTEEATPNGEPTESPSGAPTPTAEPTEVPVLTAEPTAEPTEAPALTAEPTSISTSAPTAAPTSA